MTNDIAIDREFGTEVYYCQTCNCNSLGYYQNAVCPVCGVKMIRMEYTITENKNGGQYTIKYKPKGFRDNNNEGRSVMKWIVRR